MITLGQLISQVLQNPDWVSKSLVFILAGLYLVFAVRVGLQVRRLERWLFLLQGHGFGVWALVHVGLAVLGIALVFIIL